MNIIEARGLTIQYLEPFLTTRGFEIKLNKRNEAKIKKQRKHGFDAIGVDMLNYNPSWRIRYGFNKINNIINGILLEVQQKAKLNFETDKNSEFLFFSYNTINDPANTTYLPFMESEAEIKACIDMMIAFMEETAFPLLDKFEDLRELDRIINGDEPWETDWHKPYTFKGNFYEKRLIIAKLAGNQVYEKLIDFNYKTLEKFSIQNGSPFTDNREDMNKPLPALIKVLENVKSLY